MRNLTLTLAMLIAILIQFTTQAKGFLPSPGETIAATAKSTMVKMVDETRSIYKKGMTETAFVDAALIDIPKNSRSWQAVNYFKRVFYYHNKGLSDNDIRDQENGETLIDLVSLASERESATSAFFSDANDPGIATRRPWKWWLKLIMIILSNLLEI